MALPAIPRATYRLQLHAGFTLADAEALVPYFDHLGISHLYLSPFLAARPGSLHGYDIVDHDAINPELGGMEALEGLHAALDRRGMGLIVDMVPNHMAVGGADNGWWLDVLEWGEDSPYARFFDIDWQPPRRELKGKVLLPFLGDHYGSVLERGELVPRFDRAEGAFSVWYWHHRLPIAVRDYPQLLEAALARLAGGPDADALLEVALELRGLFAGRAGGARRDAAAASKARLAALAAAWPRLAAALDGAVAALAGRAGEPASFAVLHALMERQNWRASYWRVAADEINYRRFFDINDLAALRMVEEPLLFARAHRLVFDLLRRGIVHGLRVDHVDGLFNPAEYCRQIQVAAGLALGRPVAEGAEQPLYLVVEKILALHEPIRRDWPVAGTTGYDFMAQVAGLFVDPEGEPGLTAAYDLFVGETPGFDAQVTQAKRQVIEEHMASELRVLAGRLGRIAMAHWRSRDFTLSVLYRALAEVVACLPVYRTYVTSRRVTDNDRRYIEWAVTKARRLSGGDPSVFDFVEGVLNTTLVRDEEPSGYSRRAVVDFAMRFQQYSGPVMAKGYEDTALYRYNRLIALNEVGGLPTCFGLSASGFHQAVRSRARSHPHSLLATATHDSKRGEDTRLRIAALSEVAEEWHHHLERWGLLNAPFRRVLDSGPAPEPNDEVFLYQTMLGAWPTGGGEAEVQAFVERLVPAAVKAVKEAKGRTSWAFPDPDYEAAVADFVRRICESGRRNPFLDDFLPLQRRLAALGMVSSLAQTLLKLTCPGVPDLYQGTELWHLDLVDPDNRRPVDYPHRRHLLGRLAGAALSPRIADWQDGAVKLELIRRTLDLRRRLPVLFTEGSYRPLAVRGPRADNCLAFARHHADHAVVVAVPRLLGRMWSGWEGTPPLDAAWRGVHVEAPRRGTGGHWINLLTGRPLHAILRRGTPVLPAHDLFADFPLALLESVAE